MSTNKKKGSRYQSAKRPEKPASHTNGTIVRSDFSEREWAVLDLFFRKREEEVPVTIDELNRILGVAGKTDTTRKKSRSLMLSALNTRTPHHLIGKERYDHDKRSFYYMLTDRGLELMRGLQ